MSDRERKAARLGMEALDGALVDLGYLPVGENPDVRMADPVVGDLPNAVLEKPGSAPLRFVFGRDLDVWVGPFSEVVSAEVLEETMGRVRGLITHVLRSEVTCRDQRRSVQLVLRVPGQEPWLRLKVRGATASATLPPRYAPYAS
jgi:hypothetical protein